MLCRCNKIHIYIPDTATCFLAGTRWNWFSCVVGRVLIGRSRMKWCMEGVLTSWYVGFCSPMHCSGIRYLCWWCVWIYIVLRMELTVMLCWYARLTSLCYWWGRIRVGYLGRTARKLIGGHCSLYRVTQKTGNFENPNKNWRNPRKKIDRNWTITTCLAF